MAAALRSAPAAALRGGVGRPQQAGLGRCRSVPRPRGCLWSTPDETIGELELGLRRGEQQLTSADLSTLQLVGAPLAVAVRALGLSARPPALAGPAAGGTRGGASTAASRPARRAGPHPDRHGARGRRRTPTSSTTTRRRRVSCWVRCNGTLAQPSPMSAGSSTTSPRRLSGSSGCSERSSNGRSSSAPEATAPRSTSGWWPPTRCRPCQPQVEVAAYRIATEALVNVARHAVATSAVIEVQLPRHAGPRRDRRRRE